MQMFLNDRAFRPAGGELQFTVAYLTPIPILIKGKKWFCQAAPRILSGCRKVSRPVRKPTGTETGLRQGDYDDEG
jgi:hypothetical protein